jgi:PAS domain S-box-containing protein
MRPSAKNAALRASMSDHPENVHGQRGANPKASAGLPSSPDLRVKFALDHAAEPVLWVKADGRLVYANHAAADRLGYSREEMLSLTIFEIDPLVTPRFWAGHWLQARQERILRFESMHRTRSGAVFPVEIMAAFMDFQGDECLCGYIRDISERKRIEELQRENDGRLRAILEGSPLGSHSYELQPDGRLILVGANRAADRILGMNHGLLLGKEIGEAFPGLVQTQIPAQYRKVASGAGDRLTDLVEYDHGEIKGAFEIHAFQTGPNRMSVFFRDVTEDRRAELRLRESEHKYRELVELANSIILRWTPDGRITFLNEFGQKFFGFTAEEILGRHVVGTIVPPVESTGRDLRPLMSQVCSDPKVFEVNINENIRRTGERVWIAWTNRTVTDNEGNILEVLSVGSDLTERRRLEEQLRQAQKMEAIGQLAGGVAHDLNNILTVILGNAGLLRSDKDQSVQGAALASQILEAGQRAASLTRQLLLFGRKQVMQVKTLDLNEVVRNMVRMLHRILGEDITLAPELAPTLPSISGDAGMIEQVLLNLAVNARDAMPEGGRLEIRTSVAQLSPDQRRQNPDLRDGEFVCLAVRDSGCGIPPENLPRIFEPFFTTKPLGKGTGLGLATVYGIVKQHRGHVEVSSAPGQGTTLLTYWPATEARPDSIQHPADPGEPLPGGTETLLVVEDEASLRTLLISVLQRCGYTVLSAESGVAALDLWKTHKDRIALVLTDMIMPEGLSGKHLARRLRHDRPDLKLIYMSGYSPELVGWNDPQPGITFLQKPYTFSQLAQTVRQHLDRR